MKSTTALGLVSLAFVFGACQSRRYNAVTKEGPRASSAHRNTKPKIIVLGDIQQTDDFFDLAKIDTSSGAPVVEFANPDRARTLALQTKGLEKAIEVVRAESDATILQVGDLSDNNGRKFVTIETGPSDGVKERDSFQPYDEWGTIRKIIAPVAKRFYTVPGNHEAYGRFDRYLTRKAPGEVALADLGRSELEFLANPAPSEEERRKELVLNSPSLSASDFIGGSSHYLKDFGGWCLLGLDGNSIARTKANPEEPVGFDSLLDSIKSAFSTRCSHSNLKAPRIAMIHFPLVSAYDEALRPHETSKKVRSKLRDLFVQVGVDLVLSGDQHFYFRPFPDAMARLGEFEYAGVPFAMVTTGNAGLPAAYHSEDKLKFGKRGRMVETGAGSERGPDAMKKSKDWKFFDGPHYLTLDWDNERLVVEAKDMETNKTFDKVEVLL